MTPSIARTPNIGPLSLQAHSRKQTYKTRQQLCELKRETVSSVRAPFRFSREPTDLAGGGEDADTRG